MEYRTLGRSGLKVSALAMGTFSFGGRGPFAAIASQGVPEAARLIEDGIVATPTDADVGSILGWAFPTWTGGVASFIDMVGAAKFVDDCEKLEAEFGGRFAVPQIVRDAAAKGERFNPA